MMPSQATRNLATRYTVLYTEMKKECDLLDKPFCNFLTGGGSPSRFKLAAKEYVLSRASNSQPANAETYKNTKVDWKGVKIWSKCSKMFEKQLICLLNSTLLPDDSHLVAFDTWKNSLMLLLSN